MENSQTNVVHYHCIIHQEALFVRVFKMLKFLKIGTFYYDFYENDVIKIIVKCANFVKETELHHPH